MGACLAQRGRRIHTSALWPIMLASPGCCGCWTRRLLRTVLLHRITVHCTALLSYGRMNVRYMHAMDTHIPTMTLPMRYYSQLKSQHCTHKS